MVTRKGKMPLTVAIKNAEKKVIKQCEFLGHGRVMQIALETQPEGRLIVGTIFARYLQEGMKVINPMDANGKPVTISRTSIIPGNEAKEDTICFQCELGSASVGAEHVLFLVSDSINTETNHNQ